MNILKSLKLIGEIGGITGATLVAFNIPISGYGFLFYLSSSVAWSIASYMMKEWSLFRMSIFFTVINFMGIYRWLI